jgi:hypothetical protein
LLALVKPTGGLRPIAIPEALLRVASLCAQAAVHEAGSKLAPLQVGVGVPGGAEIVGHALVSGIATRVDVVTVATDLENAFNTIDRSAVFAAVAKREPGILPYVRWLYGTPTQLHVIGTPLEAQPILSSAGVRQGDPISPLLFALTLQDPLKQTAEQHPAAAIISLHDDVHVQDDVDGACEATETLFAQVERIGLKARRAKCGAYSTNAACSAAAAQRLDIQQLQEGFVATGTPVGSATFVSAHAATKAASTAALVTKLSALPVSSQVYWAVLTGSLQQRMAHLQRTCEWQHIGEAVRSLEDIVAAAALNLLGQPPGRPPDAATTEQLRLPLRMGGCGLRFTEPLAATAAYLAGAALAHTALDGGQDTLRPFSGARAPELTASWVALHESAGDLWPSTAKEIDSVALGFIAKAQRAYGKHAAVKAHERLLARFTGASDAAKKGRARLHSVACGAASMWLEVLPTSPHLRIRNPDFEMALRLRLGVPTLPPNAPSVQCGCQQQLQPDDLDHAMTCRLLASPRMMRHNLLLEAWRRLGTRAGLATSAEPGITPFREAQARGRRAVLRNQQRVAAEQQAAQPQQQQLQAAQPQQQPQQPQPQPPPQQQPRQPPQSPQQQQQQQQQPQPQPQQQQQQQHPSRQLESQPIAALPVPRAPRAAEHAPLHARPHDDGDEEVHFAAVAVPTTREHMQENEDRVEARGDILFVFPDEMVLADVTVCHPAASKYRTGAAQGPGRAAAVREKAKCKLYETMDPYGYAFSPLVTEAFGRHGEGAMHLLNRLGDVAEGAGVHRRTYIRTALRELSVATVKGNGVMFRAARMPLARACGRDFRSGCVRPCADSD